MATQTGSRAYQGLDRWLEQATTIRKFVDQLGGPNRVSGLDAWDHLLDLPVDARFVASDYGPDHESRGLLQVSCGGTAVIGFYQPHSYWSCAYGSLSRDQSLPGACYLVIENRPRPTHTRGPAGRDQFWSFVVSA